MTQSKPTPAALKGREALLALAERCEAATGADRELDGAIDRLLHDRPKHGDYDAAEIARWQVKNGWSGLLVRGDGFARASFCAREYTASLDAAMTLVPEGRIAATANSTPSTPLAAERGSAFVGLPGVKTPHVEAATPALALTAAALRARAASEEAGRG